jgi:hypothetical protein
LKRAVINTLPVLVRRFKSGSARTASSVVLTWDRDFIPWSHFRLL